MDRRYQGDLTTIVTKAPPCLRGTSYNIYKFDPRDGPKIRKKLKELEGQTEVSVVNVYRGINKSANSVIALAIDRANEEGVEIDFVRLLD